MHSAEPLGTPAPGDRVLVAMSGGVDSSVTAALLKNQGLDVVGVHMRLWEGDAQASPRFGSRCCSVVDANDARRVCEQLEIPFYVINAQEVFQEKVVDYFVHDYLQSRTPNPCAMCNNEIKFSYLFQKADELEAFWVATGHYAQVSLDPVGGLARLGRAVDAQKDQTYFLFGLTQRALRRTLLPLGGLSKTLVRKLAAEFDLGVAQKADSQEICFIGAEGYAQFIEKRVAPELRPGGIIKTTEGVLIGEHDGLHRYTIGQKRGLKLQVKDPEAYWVIKLDHSANALIVGPESELYHSSLVAHQVNWIVPPHDMGQLRCCAKTRSRQEPALSTLMRFENDQVYVEFDTPQRSLTPGQAIVFYREDEVLGGGFIDRVGPDAELARRFA